MTLLAQRVVNLPEQFANGARQLVDVIGIGAGYPSARELITTELPGVLVTHGSVDAVHLVVAIPRPDTETRLEALDAVDDHWSAASNALTSLGHPSILAGAS